MHALHPLLIAAAAGAAAAHPVTAPTPASVLAAMALANDYFLTSVSGGLGDCGWERGTYWAGNAAHYDVSSNATLLALADQWAVSHGYACHNSTNANDQICGAAYAQLYALLPAPSAGRLALDVILSRQVANATMVEDWTWLDALFMALPTFIEYGTLLNDTRYYDKAMAEYTWTA